MPLKPKVKVSGLIRCGRCGKRYSNPLTHVCVTSRKRRGRSRLKPKVAVSIGRCGECGKEWVNPLTHVCTGGGDFARRAAAAKKAAAARKRADRHDYAECADQDCTSFPCRVYREGVESGNASGFASGQAAGRAEGYAEGQADGYAEGAAASSGGK